MVHENSDGWGAHFLFTYQNPSAKSKVLGPHKADGNDQAHCWITVPARFCWALAQGLVVFWWCFWPIFCGGSKLDDLWWNNASAAKARNAYTVQECTRFEMAKTCLNKEQNSSASISSRLSPVWRSCPAMRKPRTFGCATPGRLVSSSKDEKTSKDGETSTIHLLIFKSQSCGAPGCHQLVEVSTFCWSFANGLLPNTCLGRGLRKPWAIPIVYYSIL